MSFIFKIQDFLTRFYLRLNDRKFLRTQEYVLPNNSHILVFLYEKNERLLAQVTLFETVIANSLIETFSQDAQHCLLLHEQGHQRVPKIFNIIWIPIALFCALLLFFGFIALFPATIIFLITNNSAQLTYTLMAFLFGLFGFVSLQFLSEGHADYHALKNLGQEKYLAAKKDMKEKMTHIKSTRFETVLFLLSYPRPEWVIRFYNFFHSKK